MLGIEADVFAHAVEYHHGIIDLITDYGKDGGDEGFETVKTKDDFLKLSTNAQMAFKKANPEVFKTFLNS